MTLYEILSLSLELLVVLILLVEFWYDLYWNNREQRIKRRRKTQPQYTELNIGEGK